MIDLTGNTADVAIGTFATSLGAKAAANTNDLRFDTGTLDIRSINMAFAKGTGSSDNRITIGGGNVRLGGSTAFSDAGTGTLTLATAGSGELIINGGTVTSTVSLLKGTGGTGTATVTLNGGTLDMSGTNIGAATDTVVLAAQSGTLKNVAQINNGGTLTKSTAGTLILDGTNTYTGNTTVNAGILVPDQRQPQQRILHRHHRRIRSQTASEFRRLRYRRQALHRRHPTGGGHLWTHQHRRDQRRSGRRCGRCLL